MIGTSEDFAIADVIDDWSQSPFGFWGDWNPLPRRASFCPATGGHNRLSAFGVIGTIKMTAAMKKDIRSHNRLSAFGVIGTSFTAFSMATIRSHNRLSAFGVIGTLVAIAGMGLLTGCHNRLSAFGVIGTL